MQSVWSRHLAGIQVSDGGIGRVEWIFTTVKNREGEKMKTNTCGFFYFFRALWDVEEHSPPDWLPWHSCANLLHCLPQKGIQGTFLLSSVMD